MVVRYSIIALVSLVTLATKAESGSSWITWRGINSNGVVKGDPPVEWSESKNVRWKTAIPGSGHATPILRGDLIYVQTAVSGDGGTYDYKLIAVNRKTGKIAWEKTLRQAPPVEDSHHRTATYASTSGVTDGEHLYAYFGSQGLYCLDFDGNVKWEKDFGDMRTRNSFGEGSSPAIFEDRIVINWDHEGEDFIVVLNKLTGKELWRKTRREVTTWGTPLILSHEGQTQVIVSASRRTVSYDLENGDEIWSCSGLGTNVIPTPLYSVKDGIVYVLSGHRRPAMQAISVYRATRAKGDITDTDAVLWTIDQNTPYVSTPVLYSDRMFMTKNRNAILSCYDPIKGEIIFGPERLTGMGHVYASLVGVEDRVYISDLDGNTRVVKNDSKLEILSTNTLDEGTAATLVVDGDAIYLRGNSHLYCIGE
jgi:outer membrane protein assembly factor BamB